jgi:hypothetical protein
LSEAAFQDHCDELGRNVGEGTSSGRRVGDKDKGRRASSKFEKGEEVVSWLAGGLSDTGCRRGKELDD